MRVLQACSDFRVAAALHGPMIVGLSLIFTKFSESRGVCPRPAVSANLSAAVFFLDLSGGRDMKLTSEIQQNARLLC